MDIEIEIADIQELAEGDTQRTESGGVDLNVFSTPGARALWQNGWDGVRPPLLVDQSGNWRYWMRGVCARRIRDAKVGNTTPN